MALRTALTGISLALTACATVPGANETAAETVRTQSPVSGHSLPAQTLAPGRCGVFVWTGDADRRFILFSDHTGAKYASDAGTTLLTLEEEGGLPANGQYPQQRFLTPGGESLSLDLRDRQTIEGGTRFKGGTLTVKKADGWETVTPVIGVSACQPVT